MEKHIYIIGSKGIPAKYGGFETFVEQLTKQKVSNEVIYHVACMSENSAKSDIIGEEFIYNNAICFNIKVPNIGSAKAIYYDICALKYAIEDAKKNKYEKPVFYILACRIGPFINYFKKKINKIDGKLFVNPDGHEWLREKWNRPTREYWKLSEKKMIKHSDLIIADSENIEKYILEEYKVYNPSTKYIAYGTDLNPSIYDGNEKNVQEWFKDKKIKKEEYYLIVGRFVPENNYESMIKEFIVSDTQKDLVIITNVEKNKFYKNLLKKTNFVEDDRIKFVGTVYDQELLKYIRENAFAYLHGHEVGGTNPSLLEALFSTKRNLLLNVGFNKEVAQEEALYWEKDDLHEVIKNLECNEKEYLEMKNSKKIISEKFSWSIIVKKYEETFRTY